MGRRASPAIHAPQSIARISAIPWNPTQSVLPPTKKGPFLVSLPDNGFNLIETEQGIVQVAAPGTTQSNLPQKGLRSIATGLQHPYTNCASLCHSYIADNFLQNKLASSTLRMVFVKLIYSPTHFVQLSRTSSGSFTNESYRLVYIHSVNCTD